MHGRHAGECCVCACMDSMLLLVSAACVHGQHALPPGSAAGVHASPASASCRSGPLTSFAVLCAEQQMPGPGETATTTAIGSAIGTGGPAIGTVTG
jgi:hypothetical protein